MKRIIIFIQLVMILAVFVGCSAFEGGKAPTDASIQESAAVPANGSISGRVVSSKNEKPLADVGITVYQNSDSSKDKIVSASTDIDGSFTFDLQYGSYVLDFTKDGFKKHTESITIDTSGKTAIKDDIILESEKKSYDIDTKALYTSDLIQKAGDDVYYCSSDGAPEYMALPILDFSKVKPEYKKLPIDVEHGVQSFIIYGDSIYYISGYSNTPGGYGELYKCDLDGNDKKLIVDSINNRLFEITDYTLTCSTGVGHSGKSTVIKYDLKKDEITESDNNRKLGLFDLECIFGNMKGGNVSELDGGRFYFDVIKTNSSEPNRIDGKLANIIYYREDIETGKVDRVGYYYDQAR